MKKQKTRLTTAFLCAAMMIGTLMLSCQVNAASSVTSPYMIDGSYAYGSSGYTSTKVTGSTGHIVNTTKKVVLKAYASYGTNYCLYGTTTKTEVSNYYVTAQINISNGFTGAGSSATHTVIGASGTWSDSTNSGYYE